MAHAPADDRAPRLRSPFARAVVPVVGGLGVIGLIFLATWAMAAYIARGEPTERLAPTTFRVGPVDDIARTVDDDGPILFPGLNTTSGARTIVLDHTGDDPTLGWRLYYAYPADRDPSCAVEQVERTSRFTDCDGRTIEVTELAPPPGISPVVENRETLLIDLRQAVESTPSSTST